MVKAIDITGNKFGRLTAIEPTKNRNSKGSVMWLCECECGTIKEICITDLRSKGTKSCGCLSREMASDRFKNLTKQQRRKTSMKDIKGQRFGKLVAIRPTDEKVGTNIVWEMKCDCGSTTFVHTGNIGEAERKIKSCGCLHRDVVFIDLTGQQFGRLTVVREDGYIGKVIAWICKCECGNESRVLGSHLKSGATNSCGCLHKEMVTGKNNYNYNPHKTDEERLKKRYVLGRHAIHDFRNKVYDRDSYTCQVCRQVGGKLNAHHLDGWNWAKDKRFQTSNGITLCQSCHKEFHDRYGKGNNTKEQFEQYKGAKVKQKLLT